MNVDSTHEMKDFDSFRLGMLANLGMEAPISEEEFQISSTDSLVYTSNQFVLFS